VGAFDAPGTITTFLLIAMISIYVVLSWRAQSRLRTQIKPQPSRRVSDLQTVADLSQEEMREVTEMTLDSIFENDSDADQSTNH
jgi:hypothetical protein